jgi:hypothetical protein
MEGQRWPNLYFIKIALLYLFYRNHKIESILSISSILKTKL